MVAEYHIIGASGRSGAALCRALLKDGLGYVPVVRSAQRWAATGLPSEPRLADLGDGAALHRALQGATRVISCAHARHAPAILDASPPVTTFIFLGSTRKFTRWPDAHGRGVLAGEAAFLASGRRGVMLHPTMIYGAHGENNVRRLAEWLRHLPFVPLPNGGRALVQPIHQDDVTACIRAALGTEWAAAETMVVAGPKPMPYSGFVDAIAKEAGLPRPRIVPVPAGLLRGAALLSAGRIDPDEVRRLTEDKAFDVRDMVTRFGVRSMSFEEGLRLMDLKASGSFEKEPRTFV